MLTLKCPQCKNKMKYQSRDKILLKKKKKCVYCGFSMKIYENVVKKTKNDLFLFY